MFNSSEEAFPYFGQQGFTSKFANEFLIVNELGHGNSGRVYKCRHIFQGDHLCAVKVVTTSKQSKSSSITSIGSEPGKEGVVAAKVGRDCQHIV